VGTAIDPGNRYGKLQQDALVGFTYDHVELFVIADGHGLLGEHASSIGIKSFQQRFQQAIQKKLPFDNKLINYIFKKAHEDVVAFYDKAPKSYKFGEGKDDVTYTLKAAKNPGECSYYIYGKQERPIDFGATIVMAIVNRETKELIVAFAGDSKAVLFSRHESEKDALVAEELTVPHNANNRKEVQRVLRTKRSKFTKDGYLVPDDKALKVHQVQFTRAIGHKILEKFGVTWEPEIRRRYIAEDYDQVLVLASDGLWDNCDCAEVASILVAHDNPISAANALVASVASLCNVDDDVDNVSVIVVYL